MTEKLKKLIKFLDNPDRLSKLRPEELLNFINIKGDENFLDLGSGTGYLTLPAAKRTKGHVFAYDIEPKLLNIIKERAEVKEITNIEYVQGSVEELPSFLKQIHIVLASLILHEIEDLQVALANVYQTLTKDGQIVIVEYEIEEYDSKKPPRISSRKMVQELKRANFQIQDVHHPAEDLYLVIAKK